MEWTRRVPSIEGAYLTVISERLAIVDLWFIRDDEAKVTHQGINVRMGPGGMTREGSVKDVDYWTIKHIPPIPMEVEII